MKLPGACLSLFVVSLAACSAGSSPSGDGDGDVTGSGATFGTGAASGTGATSGTGSAFGTGASGTGAASGTGSTSGTGAAGSGGGGTYVPGTLYGGKCDTFGAQSLDDAFASLYASWKTEQVVTCGDGARVKGCPGAEDTCSEAQAYGMLLAVGAGDQVLFDQLNTYRLQMLASSSTADNSLMPWAIWNANSCPPTATGGEANSATDADVDAAMALLQAHAIWGGTDYQTQAVTTLTSIMNLEVIGTGAETKLKPGNHEGDFRDYVAYYTPGYYPVFAAVTGDSRWTELGDAYYTRLLANQCPGNGEIYDDFFYPSGDCKFWYDSCRVPWRVSLDYQWHNDADAKAFLDKLNGFVGTDPNISTEQNSAFVGAGVLSGISNPDPGALQTLCTAWANASGLDDSPYFQKTLKLLYLMVAGQKFIRP